MKPGLFPLDLYRGDSYAWLFRLWADTAKTEATDLADAVVKAEIRDKPGGSTLWPLDVAVTLPNEVQVSLDADDWGTWKLKKASWDLQITYANGAVSTVMAGPVLVTWDVTETSELKPPVAP